MFVHVTWSNTNGSYSFDCTEGSHTKYCIHVVFIFTLDQSLEDAQSESLPSSDHQVTLLARYFIYCHLSALYSDSYTDKFVFKSLLTVPGDIFYIHMPVMP